MNRMVAENAPAAATLRHAMSVDVEDYFQVQAFAHCIERAEWDRIPCRVEANVDRLLGQFDRAGVRATFFTLGWVAVRYPALVHRILAQGHELASHGMEHVRADAQTPAAFRADAARAKQVLEDAGGVPVLGYRAATFSIGRRNPWAFAELEAAGYRYSSSVFPVHHDLYGMPEAPRRPFRPSGTRLWEIPLTVLPLAGRSVPWSGGGYFRLTPYPLYRRGLARIAAGGQRAVFYLHPWEIDPAQPRVPSSGWRSRFRHYTNLHATAGRLDRLLRDFAWDRMDRAFADLLTTG